MHMSLFVISGKFIIPSSFPGSARKVHTMNEIKVIALSRKEAVQEVIPIIEREINRDIRNPKKHVKLTIAFLLMNLRIVNMTEQMKAAA